MSAPTYEVSTCRNCFEPIVRLRVEGLRDGLTLRWMHTPNRLHCVNRWREVTDLVAEPCWTVLPQAVIAA